MKKPSSPHPHSTSELPRSQEHLVRLMQHQQDFFHLGQQVNQIILNSSDSETVLQQSAQALGEAFKVDYCSVMVTADNQATAQVAYWYCDNNPVISRQRQLLTIKEKLASMSEAGCELLAIDDVHKTSIGRQWRHLPLPVQAVLEIPTSYQGKINGVISLLRSQPYHWSELEKEAIVAVAASIAIAISQVVQTRLIISLQKQVKTSAQYQTLLNQLTMISCSSKDVSQVLRLAIAGTAQALQVDRGLIITLKYADPLFSTRKMREKIPKAKATVVCEWLNSYDLGVLKSSTSAADRLPNDNASTVLNQSFWVSECLLCQQAFTNSSPVIITNQYVSAIDPMDVASLFDLNVLPALVMSPLQSGDTILGFLVVQHSCTRLWHSEELALLQIVTAQVSTAIIQSQRLRQVQSLVDERTAQLQGSLEVQAKLYEKTRQQVAQLRQLNSLKDEFLSTVNHELRTPLTSMNLAIRMLRQPQISTERQVKYLDILEQQCTQEINLINNLLKLQELESQQAPLNLETVELNPKLQNLAQCFAEKWADKGLNINLDLPKRSVLMQTDAESFDRIFEELLSNAGKYSDPDTTVVLKATHELNEEVEQIVFTLTNLGPSISPEDVTHIFDKFRRGAGVTQQAIQGTGLGLALVKCLVQHLNGNIAVFSTPDQSSCRTCFTVTLPQFLDHAKP